MKITHRLLQGFCVLGMIILSVGTWDMLPDRVITHRNIQGVADGRGSKLWMYILFPVLTIGILFLMKVVPVLDPKKDTYALFAHMYEGMQTIFAFFFLYMFAVCIYSNLYETPSISFFMLLGIGMLFVLIGNSMGKLRQNYFVGIKTPRTLSNETVWNKSHRFGGKLRVLGGLLLILEAFLMWQLPAITIIVLSTIIVGPILYSYLVYKQEMHTT